MRLRPRIVVLWLAVALVSTGARTSDAADLTRLRVALETVRFATYTPRNFRPNHGAVVAATDIAADLDLLRGHFDGLITYSTERGLAAVPELAATRGFRAVVLGVWNPLDPAELNRAIALCHRFPDLIVGLALGNEGLAAKRYTWPALAAAFDRVHRILPDKPLTTSEPFGLLLDSPPVMLERLDFLLPNIHPLSEPWFAAAPKAAAPELVVNVVGRLKALGKPILVKETGLPSGPVSTKLTPERQILFWQALFAVLRPGPDLSVAAFEAFDAPWKPAEMAIYFDTVAPGEDQWGFFTVTGRPKPVLAAWQAAIAKATGGRHGFRSR
jgi:exo-beta-1,3-glucanase (GH17 family)